MKIHLLIAILIPSLFFVLTPEKAIGKTTIDISNNGDNSTSSVKVNSNSSNGSNQTDVRIEENGEVKSFSSSGDEDINWQSEDGSTKVEVNNKSTSPTVTSSTSMKSKTSVKVKTDTNKNDEANTDDKKDESKNSEEEKVETNKKEEATESFIEKIITSLKGFLDNLRN